MRNCSLSLLLLVASLHLLSLGRIYNYLNLDMKSLNSISIKETLFNEYFNSVVGLLMFNPAAQRISTKSALSFYSRSRELPTLYLRSRLINIGLALHFRFSTVFLLECLGRNALSPQS
jgi:hypothetical protein